MEQGAEQRRRLLRKADGYNKDYKLPLSTYIFNLVRPRVYAETVAAGVTASGIAAASSLSGVGGSMRRFPSRGGLERLMNSILVGSLSEARCSTVLNYPV